MDGNPDRPSFASRRCCCVSLVGRRSSRDPCLARQKLFATNSAIGATALPQVGIASDAEHSWMVRHRTQLHSWTRVAVCSGGPDELVQQAALVLYR